VRDVRGRRLSLIAGGRATRSWMLASLCLLIALAVVGCGSSDPQKQVKRAEARVAQKQRALADAQDAFARASADFCDSSRDYLVALDRYGDVLHATAPTVGDVRTAGADLSAPRETAMTAAESAVSAHQAVAVAQQELADAQAALARASTGASPSGAGSGGAASGGTPSATPSASPLVATSTVNEVKSAEADFEAAQKGITDDTTLEKASQEFNAAAVALEVAWSRLVVEAGCLTDEEAQQAEKAVHDYTTTLQKSLAEAGYYDGKIDGSYDSATVDAVKSLQSRHGLPVTGLVDKSTAAALDSELQKAGGAAADEAIASTAALQQTLKLAGYWDGPVDGAWTPELTDALIELQKDLGVKPTGAVDAATLAAVETAIATAHKKLTATSTPTLGSPSPSTPEPSTPPASPTTTASSGMS